MHINSIIGLILIRDSPTLKFLADTIQMFKITIWPIGKAKANVFCLFHIYCYSFIIWETKKSVPLKKKKT